MTTFGHKRYVPGGSIACSGKHVQGASEDRTARARRTVAESAPNKLMFTVRVGTIMQRAHLKYREWAIMFFVALPSHCYREGKSLFAGPVEAERCSFPIYLYSNFSSSISICLLPILRDSIQFRLITFLTTNSNPAEHLKNHY